MKINANYLRSLHRQVIADLQLTKMMRHSSLRIHLHAQRKETLEQEDDLHQKDEVLLRKSGVFYQNLGANIGIPL